MPAQSPRAALGAYRNDPGTEWKHRLWWAGPRWGRARTELVLSLGEPTLADEVQGAGLSVGSLRAWREGRRNGSVNEVLVVKSQGPRIHVKARQDQEQPAIPVLGT